MRGLVLLLSGFSLSGCLTYSDYREEYVRVHRERGDRPARFLDAVEKGQVRIGMTFKDVEAACGHFAFFSSSMWRGVHVATFYHSDMKGRTYYTFRNGVLESVMK